MNNSMHEMNKIVYSNSHRVTYEYDGNDFE